MPSSNLDNQFNKMNTKTIFIFGIIFLLFIPLISSYDFDNYISYENKDLTAVIENAFGLPLIGDTLGKLTLTSHKSVEEIKYVTVGGNRAVMIYEPSEWEQDTISLGEVKFTDMSTGKEVDKDYYFAEGVYEEVSEYELECSKVFNVTKTIDVCENKVIGTKLERTGWERLDNQNEVSKNVKEIALMTYVDEGDYYDGVWVVEGKEISKHAKWIESLNSGLVYYYRLNETAGVNAEEYVAGVKNITFANTEDGDWETGIYDNAIRLGGTDEQGATTIDGDDFSTFSWSIWINGSNNIDSQYILEQHDGGTTPRHLRIYNGNIVINIGNDPIMGFPFLNDSKWHHVVVTSTESVNASLYFDGVKRNYSTAGAYGTSSGVFNIGGRGSGDFYIGSLDEIGYWDRVLTDEGCAVGGTCSGEIGKLWNSGLGNYYGADDLDVNLNYPNDGVDFSTTSIGFNCSATDDSQVVNISMYLDDVYQSTETGVANYLEWNNSLTLTEGNHNWTCYACDDTAQCLWAILNRTLTIDITPPVINVFTPEGSQGFQYTLPYNVSLNFTSTDSGVGLQTCWYNSTFNSTITNVTCNTINNVSVISNGAHKIYAYSNDSVGNEIMNSTSFYPVGIENFQRFNSTTYETSREEYLLNISYNNTFYNPTANLIYNGTSYTPTSIGGGGEKMFSRFIDISLNDGVENRSFYWDISFNSTYNDNSTTQYQKVNKIIFALCNATNNGVYINYTFKDDSDLSSINASIDASYFGYSLTNGLGSDSEYINFVNSESNSKSFAFCFSPSHLNINANVTMQYSSDGYPQRRYTESSLILTNSTTSKVLYLLSSTDGTYSTYNVQTSVGSSISDVNVQVERLFSSVWTVVETGTTGDDGAVTFFLNPDYDHRLTFTKSGYAAVTTTIRPTQSLYTITMGGGSSGAESNYTLQGIAWEITPASGRLNPSTLYTFGFNVTKVNQSNVVGCRMRLLNITEGILNSTIGCGVTGGYISLHHTTPSSGKMWGEYAINVGTGYIIVDKDAMWVMMVFNKSADGTIIDALNRIRNMDEFGEDDNRAEYSRIIAFFLLFTIILGIITYSTGWDMATSGGTILFGTMIIWIVSIVGFLNLSNISRFSFIDKYYVALVTTFICFGWLINSVNKYD